MSEREPRYGGQLWDFKTCAVIVGHPADEALWCGGTILMHPEARWTVLSLGGKGDPQVESKFYRAAEQYNANGILGDLDDITDDSVYTLKKLEDAITSLLLSDRYELIITHGLWEEYSQHPGHEQINKAVLALSRAGRLLAKQIWTFAYEIRAGSSLPRPIRDADILVRLTDIIWEKKTALISDIYGFGPESFEAQAMPKTEAFQLFKPVRTTAYHE